MKKENPYFVTFLKLISPIYTDYQEIPKILGEIGIAILSNSRGIMTNRGARLNKIEGEVLYSIWVIVVL
jgi:small subunit ribosomal protein S8